MDYLKRPTKRRFVIVRSQYDICTRRSSSEQSSEHSSVSPVHSSVYKDPLPSPSCESNPSEQLEDDESMDNVKTEVRSRSPTPTILNSIKQRRSTDRSQDSSSPMNTQPIAGRTFYSPLGSYLSPHDTADIHNMSDLMHLCEQLNLAATTNSTALSTVYPVQFILKSRAYDARMHFLAGSPSDNSLV
jgi:hypothetical protein